MMIIGDVLSKEDVARAGAVLAAAPFVDGRKTAGHAAARVKANRQADGADPKVQALAKFILQAMERSELFRLYARPAEYSTVLFNRYGPGETYGMHMDEAVMRQGGRRLRTDLSFTLFLSDPAAYEGGDLIIDGTDGKVAVKLPAGAMVLYSTGSPHEVTPVTSGERLAAVGWVQSLVRRADEREILFDLGRLRAGMAEGSDRLVMDKCVGNLMRLWAEP